MKNINSVDINEVLKPARKDTWAFNHPETRQRVYSMLWHGEPTNRVAAATGCPQATVSGVLAKITQYRNKIKNKSKATSKVYYLPECLLISPRASGFFVWCDVERGGIA